MDRITNPIADKVAATIARKGRSKKSVAEGAGIALTTFNRHLVDGEFTVRELANVAHELGVSLSDFIPADLLAAPIAA